MKQLLGNQITGVTMNELWMSVGSLILGIAATVVVSRYYFQRSFVKSLTPYIQFSSSPLRGIDPKVREQVEVKYQGHKIENLFEIQFLIANTGDKAIRDIIEPLVIGVPPNSSLLDASILHVSPEGRKIDIEVPEQRNEVRFIFPLLNSDDFFITKLLLNGSPKEEEFTFSIVADELPPKLRPVHLPYEFIGTSKKREFAFPLLTAGLVLTGLGLAITKLIYDSWSTLPSWSVVGPWDFVVGLGTSGWATIISILPAFLLLLLGVMVTVSAFTEGSFPPPKKKFIVPDNKQLLRRRGFPRIVEYEVKEIE